MSNRHDIDTYSLHSTATATGNWPQGRSRSFCVIGGRWWHADFNRPPIWKRPQKMHEIPVANVQPVDQPTRADFMRILAALEKNTEVMAQQNCMIDALERNQRPQRATNSPTRRHRHSGSPPRQEPARQRRPALERIQPQGKKWDRTPPPREVRISATTN
jgi:hypothetical protein